MTQIHLAAEKYALRPGQILLLVCLVSCESPTVKKDTSQTELPEFPHEIYQNPDSGVVYKLDREKSRVDILVRRGGTLAHLGHDHVISTRQISGYILLSDNHPAQSRADLRVDLTSLLVDEPESREKYRLDSQPTSEDINKTRINMHDKVLETQSWPIAHLTINNLVVSAKKLEANLTINLHGTSDIIPVSINIEGLHSERMMVTGSFDMLQSHLGIEPLSALGGALKVLDKLELHYSLEAAQLQWNQRSSIGR